MSKSNEHNLPEMIFVVCSLLPQTENIFNETYNKPNKKFYISKYPISISQYKRFVKVCKFTTDAEVLNCSRVWQYEKAEITEPYSYDCYIPHCKKGVDWRYNEYGILRKHKIKDYPVLYVSWFDAMEYCNYLSKITDDYYRLPTITEWLFALSFNKINTPIPNKHNIKLPSLRYFQSANMLNICCMNSYIYEWCMDWKQDYSDDIEYINKRKIIAGNIFFNEEFPIDSYNHRHEHPEESDSWTGFRIVREILN